MSQHSSRGKDWERVRRQVLERDGYLCGYCRTNQATTVDHIVPKSAGGTDDPTNLLACCRPCNLKKGSKTLTRTTYLDPDWFPTPVEDPDTG